MEGTLIRGHASEGTLIGDHASEEGTPVKIMKVRVLQLEVMQIRGTVTGGHVNEDTLIGYLAEI